MRSTDFRQANLLAAYVINEVKEVKMSVHEALLLLAEDNENYGAHEENMANFAGGLSNVNEEILKLLKKLQEEVSNLKFNLKSGKTFTKSLHVRNNTSKYCWSHISYSCTGKDCKVQFRKDGHKEEAMFSSKMEGSIEYCKN